MGTVAPGGMSTVTLTVDATGLAIGEYLCHVTIHNNDPYQQAVFVPIQLTVESAVGIADDASLPEHFSLAQNYPNPFNPTTEIAFTLPQPMEVELVVYNVWGQQVKRLLQGKLARGSYTVIWNGTNDAKQPVASGVYLYRLQAGKYSAVHKMILLR